MYSVSKQLCGRKKVIGHSADYDTTEHIGDCHQCGRKLLLQKLLKFITYPFEPSFASVYVTRKFKTTKLRNNDDRNIRRLVDAVLDRCSTMLMYDRSSEFREIDDFSADTRAFLRDIGKNQAWTD